MIVLRKGFTAQAIPDDVWENMQGKTYHENKTVGREDLLYLKVFHYDFEHNVCEGEIIVAKELAKEVLEIFSELFDAEYEIEKIKLCDEYGGNDDLCMADNNSSAFNYRVVDSTDIISMHGLGRAIDINPRYNPYIVGDKVMPPNGMKYCKRELSFRHKICHEDICFGIFSAHGWKWGGDWSSTKDYQHFYKQKQGLKGIIRKIGGRLFKRNN